MGHWSDQLSPNQIEPDRTRPCAKSCTPGNRCPTLPLPYSILIYPLHKHMALLAVQHGCVGPDSRRVLIWSGVFSGFPVSKK